MVANLRGWTTSRSLQIPPSSEADPGIDTGPNPTRGPSGGGDSSSRPRSSTRPASRSWRHSPVDPDHRSLPRGLLFPDSPPLSSEHLCCGVPHQANLLLRECTPSQGFAVTAWQSRRIEGPDDFAAKCAVDERTPPIREFDFSTTPHPLSAQVPRPHFPKAAPLPKRSGSFSNGRAERCWFLGFQGCRWRRQAVHCDLPG